MKKNIAAAVLVSFALVMAGCGAGSNEEAKDSNIQNTEADAAKAEASDKQGDGQAELEEAAQAALEDAQGEDAAQELEDEVEMKQEPVKGEIVTMGDENASLKVGMVTDLAGINDMSFNQSAWTGLLTINDSMGVRVSYIESKSADQYTADLERLCEDGNDISWGIGYTFADAVKEAAEKYPDDNFAIMDWAYDEVPHNVTGATFRSEEASYLVGYIAGNMTKTGKVGFIGGVDTDVIKPFRYGFEEGLKAADEKTGNTTVLVTDYINTFDNTGAGNQAAMKMYDGGCDIVFHAVGGAGVGVIEAAKRTGNFVIGADSDQSYLAPDNVLTSAVKKLNVAISNITVQRSMGDNIGGKSIQYGLAEQGVGIPVNHPLYSDELYDEVMDLQNRIISGDIDLEY
ncbi:MAG: BMP family ABC transporter substrate-binding protein [Lachnospiraceae bacterium]|nr:BMP family ABC transporter substrate-binding protein [Lachnospiraceae bacterium]